MVVLDSFKRSFPLLFVTEFLVSENHDAKYAIDGIVRASTIADEGCYGGQCWQPANDQADQWLQIDTQAQHFVAHVELEYRYDVNDNQFSERFKNIEVKLRTNQSPILWAHKWVTSISTLN